VNFFILYRQHDKVRAAKFASMPSASDIPIAFNHEERRYEKSGVELCDFDHLLNQKNELCGFSFSGYDIWFPQIVESRLVKGNAGAVIRDSMLQFILTDDQPETLENDCSQGVGNWVYADAKSDHMILIPEITEWGKLWERIAFKIQTENIPLPV